MRRSPGRLLRGSLLAVALVALLPVPVARAADVATTVTLNAVDTPVYRGDTVTLGGFITTGTTVPVTIQVSTDDVSWTDLYATASGGTGTWLFHETIDESVPLGTRYLRARYPGESGFLPSVSASQSREVLIRQAEVRALSVFNPNSTQILVPGSNPVRVAGEARYGEMTLEQWVDGAWNVIAGPSTGAFWVDIPALGEGDHKFRGHIPETYKNLGADQELTVTINKGTTVPTWLGSIEMHANHTLPGKVDISGAWGGPTMDGPMTVKDTATDTVIATGMNGMEFTIPALNVGTHPMLVTYDGNDDYAASSKTFNVYVYADFVDAWAVGRNYSTFYPVKDGYRDAVTISGNRNEPISVRIRIYSGSGAIVAGANLPSASGPYSYAWNGRTSTGVLRAEGNYKIVQTLRDEAGTTKAFTSYVNLSHKKLVTKTSYVTKAGSSITAGGDPGTGSIAISKAGGYTKLTAKYPNGWVGVGYQLTVPNAISYKSLAFQVYARGLPTAPPTYIGIQNFQTCPYSATWYEGCFDHWKAIGHSPLSTIWYSTSGSVTLNRYNHTVRGMVSAYAGSTTVYKVRVKVTYQVLG